MLNVKLEKVVENKYSYQEQLVETPSHSLIVNQVHEYWDGVQEGDLKSDNYVMIDLFNSMTGYIQYKTNTVEDFKESAHRDVLKMAKFGFKKDDLFIFGNQVVVGSKGVRTPEDWRQLGFDIIKCIRKTFPNVDYVILNRLVNKKAKQFVEGLYLSEYSFNKYKSKKKSVRDVTILVSGELDIEDKVKSRSDILKTIKEAKQKVQAQFLARDWVNTTPEDANSGTITADILKRLSHKKGMTVEVYDEEKLSELKMNGHLAVNRASKFDAKVVKITYTPKDFIQSEKNKIIVGVGKGLTYDSGGLSIKPGASMTTMKADKGGAMALYGLSDILSKRGASNKVVLYLAFAENMISPDSYRPDDVVKFRNGKTAHIKNTDAEGRIVLFDSLCLAQDENPTLDEIFSIATLTGAAVSQFGDEAAGMVSKNKKLFKKFYKVGKVEDEIFCEAKLHKFMMDGIKDDLADMSNTGTPNQGCQKAGLFLLNAIKKENIKKYIHLDVAGPTYVTKAFGTNPAHGTGFAVRTLFEVYK